MSIQFEKKHADKDSTNASQQSSFFFPSEDKRNLMHFRQREQRFEARSVIAGELTPNIQGVERRSRKEEASLLSLGRVAELPESALRQDRPDAHGIGLGLVFLRFFIWHLGAGRWR